MNTVRTGSALTDTNAPTLLGSVDRQVVRSTDATLVDPSRRPADFAIAATACAPSDASMILTAAPGASRGTVLPRVDDSGPALRLVLDTKVRYEHVKPLGAGGMGEVILVRDHDIARPVAVKRLLPELTDPAVLARFVDEIRTVGRLEHPNIVPIHDVGVDENGRYFFVMKYVDGETLESIIEKLAAGDPAYHRMYTVDQRIEIFIGLLHALEYAHVNGIVHRDVKPANVMVGRYGEVVLMDWGIAKPMNATRDPATLASGEMGAAPGSNDRSRAFATRLGSIVGTPAYMSPEQASGQVDRIDARSDLYSAVVVLNELLNLRHHLDDKPTLDSMLDAIKNEQFGFFKVLGAHHPSHSAPPGELVHFIVKGLRTDPTARFQSAGEMIGQLHSMREGKLKVQCHITMTKRTFREMGRFVDSHPHLAFVTLVALVSALVFAVVVFVSMLAG